MSAPGPSRRTAGEASSSSAAATRVDAPASAAPPTAGHSGQGGKKRRYRRQRHSTAAGSSTAGQSSSTPVATGPTAGGKRKRRHAGATAGAAGEDGESPDTEPSSTHEPRELVSNIAQQKGKGQTGESSKRRSSKRPRSSDELEGADDELAVEDALPDEPTTSRFFASASPATVEGPSRSFSAAEIDRQAESETVNHAAGEPTPSLSALALGLRTAASPSRPPRSRPGKQQESPLKPERAPASLDPAPPPPPHAPVASTAAASSAASPVQLKVDPALRERAVRLKLIDDLDKERRERTQEVAVLKTEMEQLRKEIGFKDSALTGERETLQAVKQSVTCGICMELLYQPFMISPCGHTACFACLKSWFLSVPPGPDDEIPLPAELQSKKCPSCRGPCRTAPTPNFLVKDLVQAIGSSLRLLDGEDPSQPAPREVSTDRDIWDGLFAGREAGQGPPPAMWDDSDAVWRCPDCITEIVEGHCSNCGAMYDVPNDGYSDDDSEVELDSVDRHHDAETAAIFGMPEFPFVGDISADEDQDEQDSEMDGFIVESDEEEQIALMEEMLLRQGASRRMIKRFKLEIKHDYLLAYIETEDPDVNISVAIPLSAAIDRQSNDRDGSVWLASYLDDLPPSSHYRKLWEEEKRERRRPFRDTPEWYLDEVEYSDRSDDGGSDEEEDESDGPRSTADNDDDDLRQYGSGEDDDLPAAYISDEGSKVLRPREQRGRYAGADEDEDEAEEDMALFVPRRAGRGRVTRLLSDNDDDEDDEPSVQTTSRHFRPRADLSVDEGSDNDPETRSPSLLDDDEDRDESGDDLDDEDRRERSRSYGAFDAGDESDGEEEEEEEDQSDYY